MSSINPETAQYCYLDIDINHARQKLATTAAFIHATDTRYGFSNKDLRELGGSELNRIPELMATDHEWQTRLQAAPINHQMLVKPAPHGSRIVLKLDWESTPLACENFATLCANGSSLSPPPPIGTSGKPLSFLNTVIHRVVPGFICQGGDLVMGNGSGGESIFNGKKFKDERAGLLKNHNQRGILGMGNSGKNSNSSQWYITFAAAPQCDGKHVIFGRVISGWGVIDAIEKCGQGSGTEEPHVNITVTDCGIWTPTVTPGDGYWFDKPDFERYTGISPVFCVRPRVGVAVSSTSVLAKFQKELSSFCSLVHVSVEEGEESQSAAASQISEWLAVYAVDVVLVAPACRAIMVGLKIAPWASANDYPREKIILETKPVDAALAVTSLSWLAKTPWYI
ncbi:hypothetical protein MPSEU_000148400 [Mayamaea pseudoterrestris]|nr:hypothetical protein MPSEU_000148400 [Mayamaea pseudoterrestris]